MKKKLLLTSILTIVMCFSLIVGSTFALFTSESKVNVAVTSGKVQVTASVEKWQYKTLTKGWTDAGLTDTVLFDNIGGQATITDSANVTLKNVVPGDGIKLSVKITNESSVSVKYKVVVTNAVSTDAKLFDAMDITVDGATYTGESESYWMNLAVGTNGTSVPVTVELPEDVDGADLMGKTCEFNVTVHAIQGNAETSNVLVNDAESLQNAISVGGNIVLGEDIDLDSALTVPTGENVTIALNGNTISNTSGYAIKNNGTLTLSGNGVMEGKKYAIYNEGNLTITGGSYKGKEDAIFNWGSAEDVVIDGDVYGSDFYAVTVTGGNIKDCTFDGFEVRGGTFTNCNFTSNGTFSGGTYDFEPATFNLAPYCYVVDNGNGTWTVVPDYQAYVDGVGYSTFYDALNVVADGGTITFAKDCDFLGGYELHNKNITIDLNGKTITAGKEYPSACINSVTAGYVFMVTGTSNVTFKNGALKAPNGGVATDGTATIILDNVTQEKL